MDRVSVIITAALLLLPAPASANVPVLCGFDNGDGTVAVGPCPWLTPTTPAVPSPARGTASCSFVMPLPKSWSRW